MAFNLGDYVTVNERLIMALKVHPKLRIQETSATVEQYGNATVLICTVTVWRDETDPLPVIASAQESLPGITPFTRQSERMVGFTSALGRALGYMGFGIDKSIASAHEVQARQQPTEPIEDPFPTTPEDENRLAMRRIVEAETNKKKAAAANGPITDPQKKMIKIQAGKAGLTDDQSLWLLCQDVLNKEVASLQQLTKFEASKIIEELLKLAADRQREATDPF